MPEPAHRQPLRAGQCRPSGKAAFPLAKARDVRKAEHAGGVEIVAEDGRYATKAPCWSDARPSLIEGAGNPTPRPNRAPNER